MPPATLSTKKSPPLAHGCAEQNLGDARARAGGRVAGQLVQTEEPGCRDLAVGQERRALAECLDDVAGDMIAPRYAAIEEHPVQSWRRRQLDIAFLGQLARERREQRLARLDTAPGQMPAAHIGVLNQEDPAVVVDHETAHTEREATGETPVEMHAAPHRRFNRLAHAAQRPRHRFAKCTICIIDAPVSLAWLRCHPAFCHPAALALFASARARRQEGSQGFWQAAGAHPPRVSPVPTAPLVRSRGAVILCADGSHFSFRHCTIELPTHLDTSLKRFADLSEQEILALAITNEEEDSRIYRGFADGLREQYPSSAQMFEEMAQEEVKHRGMLFDLYRLKFGEYMPLIRRQDVKGFVRHRPLWLVRPLGLAEVRKYAEAMEYETARFYRKAAQSARDPSIRELLDRLADAEDEHESLAHKLGESILTKTTRSKEDETARRVFMLQYVQPGLAGLMDGSVSTLAPLFAAAFATHHPWETFLVGLAASVGAGISMGFAEALSDDGSLTGRGAPWLRGGVCGLMTTIGGIGHTLPFLIPDFWTATVIAIIVVAVELAVISYIRHRFMDTPFLAAAFQVGVGGVLVFAAGILIGSS